MAQSIFSRMLPENMAKFAQQNPVLARDAQRISTATPGLAPVAAGVGLAAAGVGGFAGYQNRQRDPERLARRTAEDGELPEWAQGYLADNPEASNQYNDFLTQALEGKVRYGGMNPQDAQRLQGQTSWSFDQPGSSTGNPYSPNVNGAGGDAFGDAAVNANYDSVNDYQTQFGADAYSEAGVPTPESYGLQRDYLSQSVIDADQLADVPAAGNMRREFAYVRPLEKDRNLEQFAMTDVQAQRNLQRQQALNLAKGYENMIAGLRI